MPEESTATLPEASPQEQTPEQPKRSFPLWGWPVLGLVVAALLVGAVKLLREAGDGSYSGSLTGGGVVLLPGANRGPGPKAGEPAPEFTLQTLDGTPTSLKDYRGQVVMVNFWATWCPPCRSEMPDMEQVYQEKKQDGFTVLAVNIQEARDPIALFVNRFGLTFPILMDVAGEVTQQYGIYSLPSSYFIDREARIAEVNIGALSKAAIIKKVEAILR